MTLPWRAPERFQKGLETHQWKQIPLKEGMTKDSSTFRKPTELWQCPRCKMMVLVRAGDRHYLSMVFKFRFNDKDTGSPGWSWDWECMCQKCYPEGADQHHWHAQGFVDAFNQTCADRAMRQVIG